MCAKWADLQKGHHHVASQPCMLHRDRVGGEEGREGTEGGRETNPFKELLDRGQGGSLNFIPTEG